MVFRFSLKLFRFLPVRCQLYAIRYSSHTQLSANVANPLKSPLANGLLTLCKGREEAGKSLKHRLFADTR
jgi:hypothetical protein